MAAGLPITIAGGGLAGLTLGIALRRAEVPVTLFEAGSYPRHRVCGEFLCGRGLEVLQDLGLREKILAAGALEARTVSFHSAGRSSRPMTLPRPGLCLSRHELDALLARELQSLQGHVHQRHRIPPGAAGPGLVRATGRRLATDDSGGSKARWVGLKAHAQRVQLSTDLEVHFLNDGYVGLCRLAGDIVNVCGLFASRGPLPQLAERWPEFLRGPEGSVLRQRLEQAPFVESSFCAVSSLNLRPCMAAGLKECRLGDALSMIPPVTGNGMSLALESAAWAAGALTAYSRGGMSWEEAQGTIARRCDEVFVSRLRWASWLQGLLMFSGSRELLLGCAGKVEWLWRMLFNRTR